jgi:hypothetical protein
MMPNKFISISVFLLFITLGIEAQNLTSSPSSIYGLGDLELGEYGRNAAMSGAGIGYRSSDFLNNINPAGLSAIDSLSFFFDLSFAGDVRKYGYMGKTQVTTAANFRKISLGFRATPRWAVSAGLVPFTSVGYKIDTKQYIEGTDTFSTAVFQGSGGINKYYFSNSFKLSPKLSIGATISLLAGTIDHKQDQTGWTIENTSKTAMAYADFGMQYSDRFSEKLSYTVGATYGYKSKMVFTNHIVTTNDENVIVQDETTTNSNQYIPESYGLGVSLNWNQKFTIASDYRFQKWSALSTNYASVKYADMHKGTIGLEYIPDRYLPKSYFQVMRYRAGFTVNNSYLIANNQNPLNIAASAGIGFPLKTGSVINLSFEYGKTTSNLQSSIRESYGRFTLSFSLRETWFLKSKFD